jgi:Protein of unknown function (DUF2721)
MGRRVVAGNAGSPSAPVDWQRLWGIALLPDASRRNLHMALFSAPDVIQLSRVISEATAPAFVLGAVAAFVSILSTRLTSVVERIRHLNDIAADDGSRSHLKSDLPRLRRRAGQLNDATRLALASGVCTSLLLVVAFGSAFLGLEHVYGAAPLFLLAVALLGASLFRFGQEVGMGLSEADHYR